MRDNPKQRPLGRRTKPSPWWSVAAILIAADAATPTLASGVEITWNKSGGYAQSLRVEPGKFIELCDRLSVHTAVDWAFEASATGDFNVHYHEGKLIKFPAKLVSVSEGKGTLLIKLEQHYCWMWTNKSDAVATITLNLQRRDLKSTG